MFRLTNSLAILVISLLFTPCYGQLHQKYTVTNYTDENGLPQNSVRGIAASRDGFLWLATENGLVRFDGQSFHTFDKSNVKLSTTRFHSFWPDVFGSSARIWADNDSHEFISIEGPSPSAASSEYWNLLSRFISRGKIYIHDRSRAIFATGSPKTHLLDLESTSPFTYILLVPSKRGTYFIVDNTRIGFFSNWKKNADISYKRPPLKDLFTMGGKLYFFGVNGNIAEISPMGTLPVKLTGDILADPDYDPGVRNFTAYWNNISDQCFILLNRKFYLLQYTADGSLHSKLVLQGFDLERNDILAAYFDANQNRVFLGSSTKGLFVASPNNFNTLLASDKDMENIFYGQTLYNGNQILTVSGDVLGLAAEKFVKDSLPVLKNLNLDRQGDIYTDHTGNIWCLSFSKLRKFSPGVKQLLKTWDFKEKTMLAGAPYGRIWLGHDKTGISFIDLRDSDPHPKPFIRKGFKPVSYFLQTGPDALWVGTKKGLYRVELKTRTVKLITGTENLFIRSIYRSPSDGGIFFTTYENGVFYCRDNKLVNFPLDLKSNLTAAHCITESKDGFLWIPTNKGLFQFAKNDLLAYAGLSFSGKLKNEKLFYIYYDKRSGFNTNEFNGGCDPCSITLPDGKISLPSLNGLVWFDPRRIVPDVADKKLFVDRFELGGKINTIVGDSVMLPRDPRRISFYITTPYFGNINNLRLSYFISTSNLKPAESDWLNISNSDPVIRFAELSSGNYILQVRKMNGFGINNYETKRLVVIVPQHWYETWMFRLFCIAMLGGLVYFVVWLRTQTLNRRNEALEISIRSRTKNLEDTMIALKNSEASLSRQMNMQTRLLASISHDIRTPMKFMTDGSVRIEHLIGNGAYGEASVTARHIGASALMMNNLLDNIVAYIKTHYYNSQIGFEVIELRKLLNDKIKLFYPAIMGQHNRFSNDVDDEVSVFSNGQLLGIVLHNLLDNANKYTYKGQVHLFTEQHGREIHLIITDTGPGFPETVLQWLENSSVDVQEDGKPLRLSPDSNGLGMIIVKELAEILHIGLRVENEDGAKITLIFTIE